VPAEDQQERSEDKTHWQTSLQSSAIQQCLAGALEWNDTRYLLSRKNDFDQFPDTALQTVA